MHKVTEGIVLKETPLGENDKLLHILTADSGLITAKAKGARRITNSLHSSAQQFTYSRYNLFFYREKYTIDSAQIIHSFFGLRKKIENLTLAQHFAEVLISFIPQTDEAGEILRLFLNCLYFLEQDNYHILQIKSIFELRLLCISGFMPQLYECGICNREMDDSRQFAVSKGNVICSGCNTAGGLLPGSVLKALRHISTSDLNNLFSFKLSEENLKILSSIIEEYLLLHLDKQLMVLPIFHMMKESAK